MIGEFNFVVCRCGQSRRHGFLYRPDGRKAVSFFASAHKTAIHYLQACIKARMIPSDQETRLMCQIMTADLSHDPTAERYDLTVLCLFEPGCLIVARSPEPSVVLACHPN